MPEPLASPYRPGFNRVPPLLAGREEILAAADYAITIAGRDGGTPPPLVLVGPRGVGKTVLLSEIASRAGQDYGLPRLRVEAATSAPLGPALVEQAAQVSRLLSQPPQRKRVRVTDAVVRGGVPGVGAELHLSREVAPAIEPSREMAHALASLMVEAKQHSSGVVLTVDEAHAGSRQDLGALAAALQEGTGDNWPIVAVIAGLPSLRDDRLPSYFERADWHELGALSPEASLAALTAAAAAAAGRPYDPPAAEYLAAHTGGYPYAIQLYGEAAWVASHGASRIKRAAVESALPQAAAQLERGLFAQRLKQASGKERQYMMALAQELIERGTATGADVARRMGVTPREVSVYRDRLITKGTVVAEGQVLSFVVPGLAGYTLRQTQDVSMPGFPE